MWQMLVEHIDGVYPCSLYNLFFVTILDFVRMSFFLFLKGCKIKSMGKQRLCQENQISNLFLPQFSLQEYCDVCSCQWLLRNPGGGERQTQQQWCCSRWWRHVTLPVSSTVWGNCSSSFCSPPPDKEGHDVTYIVATTSVKCHYQVSVSYPYHYTLSKRSPIHDHQTLSTQHIASSVVVTYIGERLQCSCILLHPPGVQGALGFNECIH